MTIQELTMASEWLLQLHRKELKKIVTQDIQYHDRLCKELLVAAKECGPASAYAKAYAKLNGVLEEILGRI